MHAALDQVAFAIAGIALFCLSIAYVIYPSLMAIIGLVAYKPIGTPLPDDECPSVTLIIPCYNEKAVIAQKLENALNLDYPPSKLQIIVADDCSTDGTRSIAEQYQSERVLVLSAEKRSGKSELLNRAVAYAKGVVLCLCDANVFFQPDALRRLVTALLRHPKCGAVTGRVQLQSELSNFGLGERFYYWVEWSVQKGESAIGTLTAVDGGMYVLRRWDFHQVPLDVLDDLWQSWSVLRMGKAICYDHQSIAVETPTVLAKHEFLRRVRMMSRLSGILMRGHLPLQQPLYVLQICGHKLLRWLTPLWLLLLFCGTGAVAIKSLCWVETVGKLESGVVISWTAQCAFYTASIVGALFPALRRWKIICIPFYFLLANVGIAVGWFHGLFFRRSPIWERTPRVAMAAPREAHRMP